MPPLSVCIITYNEEDNIRTCLEAVKWADEIIVIDSKSTDKTVEICREYTDKIVLRDFPGHIEQKNYALDQATNQWVLSVDADEEVSPELAREIQEIMGRDEIDEDGFFVPRKTWYLNHWVTYGGWYPDYKLRLFDRTKGRWGGMNPHDHVDLDGPTRKLKGDLYHRTYRDISHHLQVINSFTSIAARERSKKKVKWPIFRAIFHSSIYFINIYFLRGGIWRGSRGLVMCVMGGYYSFLKYAKLWEIYDNEKHRDREDHGKDG